MSPLEPTSTAADLKLLPTVQLDHRHGIAPEVRSGKSHCAIANATNFKVAADSYCCSRHVQLT